VFTSGEPEPLDALLRVYDRLPPADELYRHYNDLMYGSTAILTVEAIEGLHADKKIAESEKFNTHRKLVGERLVERVEELLPVRSRGTVRTSSLS
jgi:hypothetical protein